MKLVDMEVEDVELPRHTAQLVQHDHAVRNWIPYRGIEAQGLFATGHETCRSNGVGAGEQCNVMALRHEFLGQIGDNALSAAVKPRRHAFDQRRNLGNPHGYAKFLAACFWWTLRNNAGDRT